MTIEAPLHLQSVLGIHERHTIDGAMAGFATHALIKVDAVIKIDVIGHRVDTPPDQGVPGTKALPHRFQHGGVAPDLRMAVHAGLGRRDAGKAGYLDRRMAIAAINSFIAYVMGMAEGHRLGGAYADLRIVRRALHLDEKPK